MKAMPMLQLFLVIALVSLNLFAADDPLEIDASEDTFLSAEHTGKPAGRGEAQELQIYGKTDQTMYRGLVKFDLKTAPAGFRTAVLRLTCYNAHHKVGGASFLSAHAITAPWQEESASWDQRMGKANWAHAGGDFDPKPAGGSVILPNLAGNVDRTFDFDLTALVRQWQAQPNNNHGVAIMVEKGCTAELRFRSKEFTTATARPKLLLYYQKEVKGSFSLSSDKLPPVEPIDSAAPTISLNSRPENLKVGEAFETKFAAGGAKAPYVFAAASQPIPGLSLSPDGTLKGKPSKAGVFIFGVACTAGNGKKATDWQRWVVIDPNAKAAAPAAPVGAGPQKDDKPGGEKKPEKPDVKPEKPSGPADE